MSNLVDYAESELALIGMGKDAEDVNKWMHDKVIKVVKAFSSGGHSGASAEYAIGIIEKILRYEPLSPLTYKPDEWIDVSEMSGTPMWQNKRKGTTFSVDGGKTHYDLDDAPNQDTEVTTQGEHLASKKASTS